MYKCRVILLLILLFQLFGTALTLFAKDDLIINHYSKPTFPGGNQNWALSISGNWGCFCSQ
jgi:phosphopantetheinyl transferase